MSFLFLACPAQPDTLARGTAEFAAGRWAAARDILAQPVAPPPGCPEFTPFSRVMVLHFRAAAERLAGNPKAALSPARESARLAELHLDAGSRELAVVLEGLAQVYADLNRPYDAEPLVRRALEIHLRLGQPAALDAAAAYNTLGALHLQLADPDGAARNLHRALALAGSPGSERLRAGILQNLAAAVWGQGDRPKALEHIQEAARLALESLGELNPEVRSMLTMQARMLRDVGRKAEARRLETYIKTLGPAAR